jgi:hypothetical protein
MPYPSLPCGRATPETAQEPFQRWPAHTAGGLQPSSIPLDTPGRTPMVVFVVGLGTRVGPEVERDDLGDGADAAVRSAATRQLQVVVV